MLSQVRGLTEVPVSLMVAWLGDAASPIWNPGRSKLARPALLSMREHIDGDNLPAGILSIDS